MHKKRVLIDGVELRNQIARVFLPSTIPNEREMAETIISWLDNRMSDRPLGERPKDFFGPEDYYGQDPDEAIADIQREQGVWDARYAALPWWRKMLLAIRD